MESKICIIIVQNSRGQLYVHQRKDDKKIFPSLYGLGAGGTVEHGETPYDAGKRELKQETGIEAELEELFSFPFYHPEVSYDVHVFRAMHNGRITPCKREFKWSDWMDIPEIDALAQQNKLCPDTKIAYDGYKGALDSLL